MAVAELGCTPAISMMVRPTPPEPRSSWYRDQILADGAGGVRCRAIRLGTVHEPIWSGWKRLS